MKPQISQNIIHYLQAGYPALYLVSPEDARVEAELTHIANSIHYNLVFWSVTQGMVETKTKKVHQAQEPIEALQAIESLPEKSMILLKDFHLFLQDANPILISKMKEVLGEAKTKNKTLIILGCRLCLPPELEREITVLDFALPDKTQLGLVLDGISESAKLKKIEGEEREDPRSSNRPDNHRSRKRLRPQLRSVQTNRSRAGRQRKSPGSEKEWAVGNHRHSR